MVIGSVLLVIALVELILGLRFIFGYQKSQSTIWYGLFCIAVATYVGANGLGYVEPSNGRIAEHLAWLGGMSTAVFFLPFSFSYPIASKRPGELLPLVIWPLVILVPGLLLSSVFVRQDEITLFGQGYTTQTGPYFWFMLSIFAVYWAWAVFNLVQRWSKSGGIHRSNLGFILVGILVSLAFSAIFDIYVPLTRLTRFGYVGSLFTSVWLGFTSYIILKK